MSEYNFVTCVYVHTIIYKTGLPGHLLTILKCTLVCVCVRWAACVCVCPAVFLLALVIQILEQRSRCHFCLQRRSESGQVALVFMTPIKSDACVYPKPSLHVQSKEKIGPDSLLDTEIC